MSAFNSRRIILVILGIVAAAIAPYIGMTPEQALQLLIGIVSAILGISLTDGLNAKVMGLPEKWKSRRFWGAIVTVLAVVAFNIFGVPEATTTQITWALITLITGITIEDAIKYKIGK